MVAQDTKGHIGGHLVTNVIGRKTRHFLRESVVLLLLQGGKKRVEEEQFCLFFVQAIAPFDPHYTNNKPENSKIDKTENREGLSELGPLVL